MENKNRSSQTKVHVTKNTYFELQASWGITKHLGGLRATNELAKKCHISEGNKVLAVGCGVGTTPCYLAKRYKCSVVGVDLSAEMIGRSNHRAKEEGVVDKVEFMVADAESLPFEGGAFDAVFCESVLAFVGDKQRAVNEFARVTGPGGYAGFNEVTWIKPPPAELEAYLTRIMGSEFLAADGWAALIEGAGLAKTVATTYKTNALSQWVSEVKQFEFLDFLKAWGKYLSRFVTDPASRRFTRDSLAFPGSIFSLFKYFGYGIYVGRTVIS